MKVYIALGGNLSMQYADKTVPVLETFRAAVNGLDVIAASNAWQSPAWPSGSGQPNYINAVIQIETTLSATALLSELQAIETQYGRVRGERNAARTLDLDILDYCGKVIDTPTLQLPHPRMLQRGFVLFPLQEIAKEWRDPLQNRAIIDWIARLNLDDVMPMKRLTSWYKRYQSG